MTHKFDGAVGMRGGGGKQLAGAIEAEARHGRQQVAHRVHRLRRARAQRLTRRVHVHYAARRAAGDEPGPCAIGGAAHSQRCAANAALVGEHVRTTPRTHIPHVYTSRVYNYNYSTAQLYFDYEINYDCNAVQKQYLSYTVYTVQCVHNDIGHPYRTFASKASSKHQLNLELYTFRVV